MDRQDLERLPDPPTLGEELRSTGLLFGLAIAVTAGVASLASATVHLFS
jgi:hypothetical protein